MLWWKDGWRILSSHTLYSSICCMGKKQGRSSPVCYCLCRGFCIMSSKYMCCWCEYCQIIMGLGGYFSIRFIRFVSGCPHISPLHEHYSLLFSVVEPSLLPKGCIISYSRQIDWISFVLLICSETCMLSMQNWFRIQGYWRTPIVSLVVLLIKACELIKLLYKV